MSFDFSNAQLPSLLPLANSYAENDVEEDLRSLLIDLFESMLAASTFDVNVLGATHLGSFDLVRKAITANGLVLLDGDINEAAARYLYRTWMSRNAQGRGLHFLRTFLQLLYPNIGDVQQLWHGVATSAQYPADLRDVESAGTFLTSRIRVSIHGFPNADSDRRVMACIAQVTPARFVPKMRYIATSTIGKIQPVAMATLTQNLHTSGELGRAFSISGAARVRMADVGVAAQLLKSMGVAS